MALLTSALSWFKPPKEKVTGDRKPRASGSANMFLADQETESGHYPEHYPEDDLEPLDDAELSPAALAGFDPEYEHLFAPESQQMSEPEYGQVFGPDHEPRMSPYLGSSTSKSTSKSKSKSKSSNAEKNRKAIDMELAQFDRPFFSYNGTRQPRKPRRGYSMSAELALADQQTEPMFRSPLYLPEADPVQYRVVDILPTETNSLTDSPLPWHVRDHHFETQFPEDTSRIVVHEFDDPDAPPCSPPRLERWESDREPVGSGGQGQVFIQRQLQAGAETRLLRAVKIIALTDGTRNKAYKYRRELETNFRFSHTKYSKYFVRSLGWYLSKESSSLCIAMEYLSQGDLQTYINHNPPLSEDDSCEIVNQVFTGLRIMHREGFAHRDIKPANVLIQQCPAGDSPGSWWVKLTDFGISKPLEGPMLGNTTLCGTPGYMAPEITRQLLGLDIVGKDPAIDYPAADIWSLGTMMYRMLAGCDPFPSLADVLQYCKNPKLFPGSQLVARKISHESVAFSRVLLQPLATERQKAVDHVWFKRFVRIAPVATAAYSSITPVFPGSVMASSLDDERGLTTQLSYLTVLQSPLPHDDRQPMHKPIPTLGIPAECRHGQLCPVEDCQYSCPGLPEGYEAFATHLLEQHLRRNEDGSNEVISDALENSSAREEALQRAALGGYADMVEILLRDPHANIETRDEIKYSTPLHNATFRGHEAVVRLLLRMGANKESRQRHTGKTSLSIAAEYGELEVAKLLLDEGADLATRDWYDESPLLIATFHQHVELVKLFLERGAAVDRRSRDGDTSLSRAVRNFNIEIVRLLLQHHANIEAEDRYGQTPLALAARRGRRGLAQLLLRKGARIDSQSKAGATPLIHAVQHGHTGLVRLLLSQGANPRLPVNPGLHSTPLERAEADGDPEMIKLIRDAL